MDFLIEEVAKEYIYRRFPRASIGEKEKYVRDWKNKIKDSQALVRDFRERVGDPKGKKILDVGSGNGGISIAFAQAGADVSGIEIEEDLYKIGQLHAKSYGVTPIFYLYDGQSLPFQDNSFDYAVSASVLEHTDDPVRYLNEILRVVKPGGSLYLGFPNKWAPIETHTQLPFLTYLPKNLRSSYIKTFHRNPLADNNLHFYSYFDLLKMIKPSNDLYKWVIVSEEGKSQNIFKKSVRNVLKFFGIPYKSVLKHILVILKKEKI